MERETKEIEIAGHTFHAKTYATAREANAIQQAYFLGTKLEVVGETPKISEFNPGVQFEVYQEMVRQMLVSMDGSAEDIVGRCLDLPSENFDELVQTLDQIVSKKELEASIGHYAMGRMDRSMQMVAIMQEFGWTYREYAETPNYVLTLITEKMKRDRKRQELAAKQK